MSIRNKIILLFTGLTGSILFLFAVLIYYTASQNREKEFFSVLEKEAITKASLFFEAQVPVETLQNIYLSNRKILNEVEVAIYDDTFTLLYHDALDIDVVKETPSMLNEIKQSKKIQFYQDKWQVIGIIYPYNQKNYIITATALDGYGYRKQSNLLTTLIISFFASLFIIFFVGKYFSRKVTEPVKKITQQVQSITASNLHLRIPELPGNDEIANMAQTFNEMLERLDKSFEAQKFFVSSIAHEIRTPLSSIVAELELAIASKQNTNELKSNIQQVLNDSKLLAKLTGSLLDFAKASYDEAEISFRPVNIELTVLYSMEEILKNYPNYQVYLNSDFSPNDEPIIMGNEYLLKVASMNLIENACKFSPSQTCFINISIKYNYILLEFKDEGIGISDIDQQYIFNPFYRGENKYYATGSGIGLTLSSKIIELHKGKILLHSIKDKGTTVTLSLPLK